MFFRHILSSLMRTLRNFPGGHPSLDYSQPSTLNYGVTKEISSLKERCILLECEYKEKVFQKLVDAKKEKMDYSQEARLGAPFS